MASQRVLEGDLQQGNDNVEGDGRRLVLGVEKIASLFPRFNHGPRKASSIVLQREIRAQLYG